MSLNEDEQRELHGIEQQLRREDPAFAGTFDARTDQDRRHQWRRIAGRLVAIGLLVALVGLIAADGLLSVGSVIAGYGVLSVVVGGVLMVRHRSTSDAPQRFW